MFNFTQEDYSPSESTLNVIRQIAYTYRVFNQNGQISSYCLN